MELNQNGPTIVPTLRYHDAPGAIRFLTEALGLAAGEITYGPDDRVAHAELGWGNGTVMVSSRADRPSPFDTGRACLYLVVDDPDALHGRAVAAGAEIVMRLMPMLFGFYPAQVLHTLVRLDIAELLADGPVGQERFDYLAEHPAEEAVFNEAMSEATRISAPAIVAACGAAGRGRAGAGVDHPVCATGAVQCAARRADGIARTGDGPHPRAVLTPPI